MTSASTHRIRLSEELRALLPDNPATAVSIGSIFKQMEDRGAALLTLTFGLPFCIPIPLPGLSVPFGVILILFGLCLMRAQRPWLPESILKKNVPHGTLKMVIEKSTWLLTRAESMLKPRFLSFTHRDWARLHGATIVLMAFLLSLPLPIPGTNMPPALCIVLLSLGLIERDGVFVFLGYVLAVLNVVLFGALGVLTYTGANFAFGWWH